MKKNIEYQTWANSGKAIAQGKGVRGDAESEGSRRQTSAPTNRNFIQGQCPCGKCA